MASIFLAFYNAAAECSHVLLPRAIPFATTHLPDSCDDGIDLSVFHNSTHSIARIRVFEDYVLLSALPDGDGKVCIHTASGKEVEVPKSTFAEITWFLLEDGSQFTYAAVRCSVEFDHDNSISNSMRPPQLSHPTGDMPTFADSEMLRDKITPEEDTIEDSTNLISSDDTSPFVREQESVASGVDKQTTSSSSATQGDTSVDLVLATNCSTATIPQPLSKPGPHATRHIAVLDTSKETPTKSPSLDTEGSSTPVAAKYLTRDNFHRFPTSDPPEIASFFQQSPKGSQLDTFRNKKREKPVKKEFEEDLQVTRRRLLTPTHSEDTEREGNMQFSPTGSVPTGKLASTTDSRRKSCFTRKSGEQSQLLPDHSNTTKIPLKLNEEQHSQKPGRKRASGEESQILEAPTDLLRSIQAIVKNAKSLRTPLSNITNDSAVSSRPRKSTATSAKPKMATLTPSNTQNEPVMPLDILNSPAHNKLATPNTSNKATFSLFSFGSPASNVSMNVVSGHESEDDGSDTVVMSDPPQHKAKRRKLLRGGPQGVNFLSKPTLVFSSKCVIQNKKKTLQSFSELGGKVVDDIEKAHVLCTPVGGELKKTSKFILAVILGKIIVTEDWVVDCARKGRIVDPYKYLPRDEAREAEWNFKLSEAVERGRDSDGELTRLFKDYKLYMTLQLENQLRGTNNLEAFVKICMAMGVKYVRKRIPVLFGSKMIVLGVKNDFERSAVRSLGFRLYDKDLLTMSALRGERQDDTDEFEIEMPIKEEEFEVGD